MMRTSNLLFRDVAYHSLHLPFVLRVVEASSGTRGRDTQHLISQVSNDPQDAYDLHHLLEVEHLRAFGTVAAVYKTTSFRINIIVRNSWKHVFLII